MGTVTTGAANDIEKATRLAEDVVTRFGMSEELGMMALATMNHQYLPAMGPPGFFGDSSQNRYSG